MFYSISWGTLWEFNGNQYVFSTRKLKAGITYVAVLADYSRPSVQIEKHRDIKVLYKGPMSLNNSKQHIGDVKRLRQQIIIFELCEQPQVDAPDVQKEVKTPVVTTF
jgi:hypothetical protein